MCLAAAILCWLVLAGAPAAFAVSASDEALNRFYMMKDKEPAQARAALGQAARQFPNDARIQLE